MDAVPVADVGGCGDAAMLQHRRDLVLVLYQDRQFGAVRLVVGIRRDLYQIVRHFRVPPQGAPLVHHGGSDLRVVAGVVQVGFSLVPDETAGRIVTQRIDHAVEQLPGGHFLPVQGLGEGHVDVRRILQRLHAEPGLDGRAAPVGHKQADGDLRHELGKGFAEVIGRGAELARGRRRGTLPGAGAVFLQGIGIVAFYREHAHHRRGRGVPDGFVGVGHALVVPAAQGHLHVGLAAADPDLADGQVPDRNFIFS